jgi:mRNA-degrading endonuclease toxin of MazEF toxin-antitoxin module
VPALVRGSVVRPKFPVPDPQGRNPTLQRPFVVVSDNAFIETSDRILLVGITRKLRESPREHYVELPYGRLVSIPKDQVTFDVAHIPPTHLEQIGQKLAALRPAPMRVDPPT